MSLSYPHTELLKHVPAFVLRLRQALEFEGKLSDGGAPKHLKRTGIVSIRGDRLGERQAQNPTPHLYTPYSVLFDLLWTFTFRADDSDTADIQRVTQQLNEIYRVREILLKSDLLLSHDDPRTIFLPPVISGEISVIRSYNVENQSDLYTTLFAANLELPAFLTFDWQGDAILNG
jgi:hypothetical protein